MKMQSLPPPLVYGQMPIGEIIPQDVLFHIKIMRCNESHDILLSDYILNQNFNEVVGCVESYK